MPKHTALDYRAINRNYDPAPMPGEAFKSVPGYPGYDVSDYGRVISHKRGRPRVIKGRVTAKGYHRVALRRDGKVKDHLVHRLVALAHTGPAPDAKPFVLHANDISEDNRLVNIRYGTIADNNRDRVVNGNHPYANKTYCKHGHVFVVANTRVYADGRRKCISCKRSHDAARSAAKTGRPFIFNTYADQKYIELTSAPGANLTPVLSAA